MSDPDYGKVGQQLLAQASRWSFTAGPNGIIFPAGHPLAPAPAEAAPAAPATPPAASQADLIKRIVAKTVAKEFAAPPSADELADTAAGLAPETEREVLARANAIGARARKLLADAQAIKNEAKQEKKSKKGKNR